MRNNLKAEVEFRLRMKHSIKAVLKVCFFKNKNIQFKILFTPFKHI